MARQLGDTEYVGSCRFEWFEQRPTGELCGWFFLHYPDSEPDVNHRLWIIESPPLTGETEPSYFVQPGPAENPGWPLPSLEMAVGYLIGWFNGRNEW
jgi:hypothetical protein